MRAWNVLNLQMNEARVLQRYYTDYPLPLRYSHQNTYEATEKVESRPTVRLFSSRMMRLKLMQNHRRQTVPCVGVASSSSTSTVPLSSSELFYGNDLSHHDFTEDISTGDTAMFDRERDKQKLKELDVGNRHMINRGGINRKAANFDKVTYDYEREDQHPVANSVSSLKQFPLRTNGLKNNSIKGEQYFNHRNSAGREDDLVAMGTLWSPGQVQTRSSYISTSSCKSSNGTCISSASTTTGTLPIRRSLNLSTSCSTRQLLSSSISQSNTTAFALTSMGNVKSSKEVEPKYADPLAGAPSLFQQRLMELAALEAETVRWEKAKKVKKKPKQDS